MHRSYSGSLSYFTRKLQWLTFQLSKSQLPFSYMVHQYTSTQPVDTVSVEYINNVGTMASDADDKRYSLGYKKVVQLSLACGSTLMVNIFVFHLPTMSWNVQCKGHVWKRSFINLFHSQWFTPRITITINVDWLIDHKNLTKKVKYIQFCKTWPFGTHIRPVLNKLQNYKYLCCDFGCYMG